MRVSVVVPTYRRPDLLERCLAALGAQRLDEPYEVIVADDAASGATQRQVAGWSRRFRDNGAGLRYLAVNGRHGPAAARNAGWRAARGAVIAFTDDDCIPLPDWLARGLAPFAGDVDGVSGRVDVPLPTEPTDYERNAAALARSEFVTANCFYRRAALESVDGFDERFAVAWREDSDLAARLRKRGARLVTAPDAVVLHPIRPAGWGVSLTQQRKSMYNALLYKKHRAEYRAITGSGAPWHYYRILAALLTALGGLLLGHRRLALLAGLTWAAQTARFCARRLDGTSRAPAHLAEMIVTSALIPPLSIFWRIRGALKFRVWFL